MNKQDIDDLLIQAHSKGSIHKVGPKSPEKRSLFQRLGKIGTPFILGAALLTTIAGCSPQMPDLGTSSHQTTEMTAPFQQDFIKEQLQKEIMENGVNIIVTQRFVNHKASAEDYLQGQQWDGTKSAEHNSKYVIGYETVNPNAPQAVMVTQYAGVSKELFDAVCQPVRTYESTHRTTDKCELPSGKGVTYSQDFYGGPSQLKGDYTVNPDGSINKDSLSLRISNASSPSEFTELSQVSKDGVIQEAGSEIFVDQSVSKEMGEIYQSVKLSASSLKSKIERRGVGEKQAPDAHLKAPFG